MDPVPRSAGAVFILSFAIVFIAIAPDVMASGAKSPAIDAPRTAALQSLPAPLQAQLRRAALQDSAAGLRLSDDGATYTYTAPSSHAKGGESAPYAASLSCDPSLGVEVTVGNSEYSLRLIPLIPSLMEIQREGEVLAYSTPDGSVRLDYEFKRNGLKEDIVLSQPPASDWMISFQMQLDPMLEAKQDSKGNVLVYGPDSVLSGFIQTGDDASARLVMKARRAAPRTNLLYLIPAPVVTDGMGQVRSGATYSLKPGLLELHLRGAEAWPGPLTIDPSIVVTTTADFGAGNDEGMISFDTDAISRAAPSGGMLGDWSATSSFETARYGHTSVAYNGYLYVIGGQSPGYMNDVQYAPMASDGSLGAWSSTTGFPGGRYGHTSVAYNGYLYIIGGRNSSYLSDVQSAPIHSDGTVGAWSATTSFATARYEHTSVAYNGYLYVIGGRSSSAPLNDIQVALINANGTVGTWSAATSFSTARYWHTSAAYNGHLYIIGGRSPSFLNDVQVAPINSDGTAGAWSATTSLTAARFAHASVACNGYLYILGGSNAPCVNMTETPPRC